MSENQKKILEMLSQNKISVDEASQLLNLTDEPATGMPEMAGVSQGAVKLPKYLRVLVQPNPESGNAANYDHVNVRVPISLIRAGMRLAALIPEHASDQVNEELRKKGINMDIRNIKAEDLEQLVDALSELEVDVKNNKETVRVFLE